MRSTKGRIAGSNGKRYRRKMIVSKRLDKRNKKGYSEKSEGISLVLCIQNRKHLPMVKEGKSQPRTTQHQVGQDCIMVKVVPSQMDTRAPVIIPEDHSLVL